jgi:hypothetical protein
VVTLVGGVVVVLLELHSRVVPLMSDVVMPLEPHTPLGLESDNSLLRLVILVNSLVILVYSLVILVYSLVILVHSLVILVYSLVILVNRVLVNIYPSRH